MNLERKSDKNLVRWYRREFEALEKGGSIRNHFSPGQAARFKKRGLTTLIPAAAKQCVKTTLSHYASALLKEIVEEDDN